MKTKSKTKSKKSPVKKLKVGKFWSRKMVAFVLIFAAIAGVIIYKSHALTTDIVIKGRVTVNGVGVPDVYIDGCNFDLPGYGVAAITNSTGYFSYTIHAQPGQGYCSRVFWTDYLPATNVAVAHNKAVLKGVNWPAQTVNRAAFNAVGRYEFQIAGANCYNAGTTAYCTAGSLEQKWDLASDGRFTFAFTSNNPIATPPTTGGNCPLPAGATLTGTSTKYTGVPPSGQTVDARGYTVSDTYGWMVVPSGGSNVCWLGGEIKNTIADSATGTPTSAWANYWHKGGGFDLKNANGWTVDSVKVHHTGDGFNVSQGNNNTLRNSHVYDIRDDCVQNDYYLNVSVHDNYFECYSGFSSKASSGQNPNGTGNTFAIVNNIVYMKPMWSVYKGDSPGNGHLIKWAQPTAGLGTPEKLVFKNNVVRIDKCPFQSGTSCSATYFPTNADWSGNALYWGGSGSPPAELVNWFGPNHASKMITATEWNNAVNLWKTAHPGM